LFERRGISNVFYQSEGAMRYKIKNDSGLYSSNNARFNLKKGGFKMEFLLGMIVGCCGMFFAIAIISINKNEDDDFKD